MVCRAVLIEGRAARPLIPITAVVPALLFEVVQSPTILGRVGTLSALVRMHVVCHRLADAYVRRRVVHAHVDL